MKPIDNIQLTAYALGELSAEERQQVEEQLKDNPEQQAAVAEIQALAGQLESELKAEPAPELTTEQRNAILGEPHGATQPHEAFAWRRLAAIAAVVTLVFGGLYWNASRTLHKDLLVSMNETSEVAIDEVTPMDVDLEGLTPPAESPELFAMGGRGSDPQSTVLRMVEESEAKAPMIPAPEVQEFAAAPADRVEAAIQDSLPSPIIMKSIAPSAMASRRGGGSKQLEKPDFSIPPPSRKGKDFDKIYVAASEINGPIPETVENAGIGSAVDEKAMHRGQAGGVQVLSARAVGYIKKTPSPDGELIALSAPLSASDFTKEARQIAGRETPTQSRDMSGLMISGFGSSSKKQQGWLKLGREPASMTVSFDSPPPQHSNTEAYAPVVENPFKQVANEPLSTFSIDVDTASYANIRRFLKAGQMPPPDAVRVEEMINYFSYDYPQPEEDVPFAVHVESAACPWNEAHQLVKIGLKGKELDPETRPPCNLVFLLDVSGSMSSQNKLPLVKKALKLLAKQLTPEDRVSIVVYASASGLVLPATSCDNLQVIESALDQLQSGGSTAGGAGIRLAYDEALKNLQTNGVNRVILCTDGDFNVGITDSDELASFIASRAKKGIYLTVLGFGMGNYKDDRLETLADKGNGNYAYIDTFSEARKNLSEQAAGTLFTIAKDVKLQIEFNPAHFDSYRLIGYENRVMAKEDFNNDKKDAGELGAGHTVTAFYELVPKGVEVIPGVDPLKYQAIESAPVAEEQESDKAMKASPEWLTVTLRYKLPDEDTSTKIEIPFTGTFAPFDSASVDFRFAAGVAAGGLLMREDSRIGDLTYREVIGWTSATTGNDPSGYRREYLDLLKNAAAISQ